MVKIPGSQDTETVRGKTEKTKETWDVKPLQSGSGSTGRGWDNRGARESRQGLEARKDLRENQKR